MATITLEIEDARGRAVVLTTHLEQPLGQFTLTARDALDLPIVNLRGQTLRYALFHLEQARFLNPDVMIHGHHLEANDRLRLVPRPFGKLFELELQSAPNPGMLYPMSPRDMTIGREFGNDIVVRHKTVSRDHGLFEWADGFHLYLDLESANGSWLNNLPVTRLIPIANGDRLTLGQDVHLIYREREKDLPDDDEEANAPQLEIDKDGSRTKLVSMPRAQVYISYSEGQAALVQMIIAALEKVGIQTLYDVPADKLDSTLQRVQMMIAILSREAVGSAHLQEEWRLYEQLKKPILPVLFEPCRIPAFMAESPTIIEYTYNDTTLSGDVAEAILRVLR